jgi:hypothetical protein
MIDQPGVYDIPADVYHSDPVAGGSLSSSGARKLLPPSCPALFRHWADEGQEHKATFDLGHAAHAEVLGVGAPLAVVDADDWRTKAAKQQRDTAYAAGATPLLRNDYEQVHAMAAALRAHPVAGSLFTPGTGRAEQTLVWRDDEFGVWRRAMLDWLTESNGGLVVVDYKGLALDTAIPTPHGWTTMHKLRVGQQVVGANGRPCTVTAKSEVHYRTCYRIRFDDGASVVCDDEHLWLTTSGGTSNGTTTGVRSTDEIRRTLLKYGQHHHRVPVAAALDLPERELPISPYVLGCWLGDGTAADGCITKPDDELFELIEACGYKVGPNTNHRRPECPTRTVYGLRTHLRRAGLLGHKQVPDAYLRASADQRRALLRGLMDTDGSWNAARSQAVFMSTDKVLSVAVRELACSLGQRAVMHETTQHGYGLTVTAYPVTFSPVGGLNPFALARKANLVGPTKRNLSSRRVVIAVEEMPTVPTQCITVDSPDSTYLCTEAFIPTHNTCRSAEPGHLSKTLYDFGYYQQDPYYRDGVEAVGLAEADAAAFVFVFQEKTPPYLITIVQADPEAVEWGRRRNRKALDTYRVCTETGHWPGYGDAVLSLSLPRYATYQLDAAHARGDYDPISTPLEEAS